MATVWRLACISLDDHGTIVRVCNQALARSDNALSQPGDSGGPEWLRQDSLAGRLNAPYALRIQREIRHVLFDTGTDAHEKVDALAVLADHHALAPPPPPPLLPAIDLSDIHLLCWTAITPADDSGS